MEKRRVFKLSPEAKSEVEKAFDTLVAVCEKHECPYAVTICTAQDGPVSALWRSSLSPEGSPLPIRIASSAHTLAERVNKIANKLNPLISDLFGEALSAESEEDAGKAVLKKALLMGRALDKAVKIPPEASRRQLRTLFSQLKTVRGIDSGKLLAAIVADEEKALIGIDKSSAEATAAMERIAYFKLCLSEFRDKSSILFGDAALSSEVKEAFYGAFDVIRDMGDAGSPEWKEKRVQLAMCICNENALEPLRDLPDLVLQTEEHLTLLKSMTDVPAEPGDRTQAEQVAYEEAFLDFLRAVLNDLEKAVAK